MTTSKGIRVIVGLLLVILLLVPGCSDSKTPVSKGNIQENGFPVTVKDGLGNEVLIPKEPQRIVSLSPSNTEILFALGLKDRIVGVTNYCDYPPEARKKEKVGGYSDPNLEKIISLDPDLVVAGDRHDKIAKELKDLSVPVLVVNPQNLADTLAMIEKVGIATGQRAEAQEIVEDIRNKIDGVKAKLKGVTLKPRVYYEIWYSPLVSVGPNTVIDDIITLCGGVNVTGDAPTQWPQYSEEALIAKNPDVIIHSYSHGDLKEANIEGRQGGWQDLNAIKNRRIYVVDADVANRPGPRITQAIDEFARAIHPELFK